jgi:hypothetical protein
MERATMGVALTARDIRRKAGGGSTAGRWRRLRWGRRSPPEEASGRGSTRKEMERAREREREEKEETQRGTKEVCSVRESSRVQYT